MSRKNCIAKLVAQIWNERNGEGRWLELIGPISQSHGRALSPLDPVCSDFSNFGIPLLFQAFLIFVSTFFSCSLGWAKLIIFFAHRFQTISICCIYRCDRISRNVKMHCNYFHKNDRMVSTQILLLSKEYKEKTSRIVHEKRQM